MSTSITAPAAFLATRKGKLTLLLLCAVGFLDFVDASIVNIALPDIRDDLHFSTQNLQWVLSGYLLTYGGFMLLGGRAGDLLGRRRVLVAGTVLFAAASLTGGLAVNGGELVGARLAQGLGAALMLPAALSLLTTSFTEGRERNTALGVWGGVAGLASAVGVFLGGVLTEGPGWRWVLFVNPLVVVALLGAIFVLIPPDTRTVRAGGARRFDLPGSVLVTGGMLLLVYALVKAPDQGWSSTRTVSELAGAAVLLVAFVFNEQRGRNPLIPMSTFRIPGLAAADVTMLVAAAGLIAMFFFLTLYMQNVLGYSPLQTGAAYLPFTAGVAVAAGIASQLMTKVGTRAVIVVGTLVAAGGLYMLSGISADGSFVSDLLPGMMVASVGLGAMFVAVTTAANAGVPPTLAGLAAALLNASQQVGAALGLAIFTAIATARTDHLLAGHASAPHALTAGFQRALVAESLFMVGAALVALRTKNTHEQQNAPLPDARSEVLEAVEA